MARRWQRCRRIHASPTCCYAVMHWGWGTWPATLLLYLANEIYCLVVALTCTTGWPCLRGINGYLGTRRAWFSG
ncbi:hypothetical protein D3C78_1054820 [compost metagenome]